MNKKILLSVAAAATLAMTFTGCGSSDSAATSGVTGSAAKAELNGATVSFGGATATTTSTGAFTVSGATAGATAIEISDGNYSLNNVVMTNTVVLKATKTQVDAGAPASMLTTLIAEFDADDIEKAYNALGLTYVDGADISLVEAGDFESAAVNIAMLIEFAGSTGLSAAMTSLAGSITAGTVVTPANLASYANLALAAAVTDGATVSTAATASLAAVGAAIVAGKPLGYALAQANAGKNAADGAAFVSVPYDVTDYQMTNVIDTNATDTDASNDVVAFSMTNSDANLTDANGNTSLYLSIKGLDAANLNTSYVMGITNLDIVNSSNVLTLNNANASAVLTTVANSNISYAMSMDTNASTLATAGICSGNDINVTAFSNYAAGLFAESNSTTVGTFAMSNGNYSVKAYVNIADQKMTKDNRLTDIISSSMSTSTNDGSTIFSGARAYKVLDTNLTK